jgi:hypothetical protein
MAERKHEADRQRAFPVLHQFPDYVVDRRYVVRIDGMTQSKAVRENRRSQKYRVTVESNSGPQPCPDIECEQNAVHDNDPAAEMIGTIAEQSVEFGSFR